MQNSYQMDQLVVTLPNKKVSSYQIDSWKKRESILCGAFYN